MSSRLPFGQPPRSSDVPSLSVLASFLVLYLFYFFSFIFIFFSLFIFCFYFFDIFFRCISRKACCYHQSLLTLPSSRGISKLKDFHISSNHIIFSSPSLPSLTSSYHYSPPPPPLVGSFCYTSSSRWYATSISSHGTSPRAAALLRASATAVWVCLIFRFHLLFASFLFCFICFYLFLFVVTLF